MAAANNLLTVEQQLWTLVLAWPGITSIVKAANFIRFDVATNPQPDQTSAFRETLTQLPQLRLEILNSRLNPKAPRTFCLQPNISDVVFEWVAQGPDKTYNTLTQILAELNACFIASGTQLGIPAIVARWTTEMRMELASNQNANVNQHRQARLRQLITIKG